jgi:acyl-CoA thioesterase-1
VKSWGVAVAVTALVLGGVLWWTPEDAHASRSRSCRAIAEASQARHDAVTGTGTTIAVIGDSYSMGSGLDDPATSWASRLDGRVVVDGFGGSGFSAAASPCRGVAFPRRVSRALAADPRLVVVQGGLNDFDVPDEQVRAGALEVLRQLRDRRVVVVGPPSAPLRTAGAARVDAILADVAADAGVPYVRTSSWDLGYLDDRLHLTAAGHVAFGNAVATELKALLR